MTTQFNTTIAEYVRSELLSWIARFYGTTSDSGFRGGMVLVDWAERERDEFLDVYGDHGCTCFISPPCGYCTHPGNPDNQEECDECWQPVLKGGAA